MVMCFPFLAFSIRLTGYKMIRSHQNSTVSVIDISKSVFEFLRKNLYFKLRKMRFFVFLLSVSVAIIQGNAQYQAYYRDSLYPSPLYQDIQPPNQENRIFFNQFYSAFTSFYTSTTTTTSTSTTTCTVLNNVVCPGRRKRFTVGEQDDTIEASPVNQYVKNEKKCCHLIDILSSHFVGLRLPKLPIWNLFRGPNAKLILNLHFGGLMPNTLGMNSSRHSVRILTLWITINTCAHPSSQAMRVF